MLRLARPARSAMLIALAASGATMLAHNLYELPLPPIAIENSGPLAVDAILALAYAFRPRSIVVAASVLIWGLLNLVVGGVLSVLPLPILPFVPEQSLPHYLAHVVYGAGQLPVVILSFGALQTSPSSVGTAVETVKGEHRA